MYLIYLLELSDSTKDSKCSIVRDIMWHLNEALNYANQISDKTDFVRITIQVINNSIVYLDTLNNSY